MSLLKKLLKWLLILALVLAVTVLAALHFRYGVNLFKGDAGPLWTLVDFEVDFFARGPGTKLLRTDLADGLSETRVAGSEWINEARTVLMEQTKTIAREANPNLPFGEVDFEEDFLARDMAFAGQMRSDVENLKLDSFIFLTRTAWYGRFLSALRADEVRSQTPFADRLELEGGGYFKLTLLPQEAEAINRIMAKPLPGNVVYFGQVRDVFVLSDRPLFIESAISGSQTLQTDAWFDTEDLRAGRSDDDVEVFLRGDLAKQLLSKFGNPDVGGPLAPVSALLPLNMVGQIHARVTTGEDGLAITAVNTPSQDAFKEITKYAPHLRQLYEREKADLTTELSRDGIARYIPRERTIAALVFEASPEELAGVLLKYISPDALRLFEDELRQTRNPSTNRRYANVQELIVELMKDFADTHLLVLHHPSVFEGRAYATMRPTEEEAFGPNRLPAPQFFFTLVSRLKDSAVPDKVRKHVQDHLPNLQLENRGLVQEGAFAGQYQMSAPKVEEAEFLIRPAFCAMPGGARYFVFGSHPEGVEAVLDAAQDDQASLLSRPGARDAVDRMLRLSREQYARRNPGAVAQATGTLALVLQGAPLRNALYDRVRLNASAALNLQARYAQWRPELEAAGMTEEEIELRLLADGDRYVAQNYPEFRDDYARSLEPLRGIDVVALSASLGVDSIKRVTSAAWIRFRIDRR